jgi:hypothetical protein
MALEPASGDRQELWSTRFDNNDALHVFALP